MDHQLLKSLYDQKYERRKFAALELEKDLLNFLNKNELNKIKLIIDQLSNSLNKDKPINIKNGGLIGLAAAAIALNDNLNNYLDVIINPILLCFNDQDSRIRYFACESMYNIAKVSKSNLLPYFDQLFENLIKLSSDTEISVKNGSELLDRLLKDIIIDNANLINLDNYLTLIEKRIYVVSPFTRIFLISWLTIFDSISDLQILNHLSKILDGLFRYLSDNSVDVKTSSQHLLDSFLNKIVKTKFNHSQFTVDYLSISNILINHLNSTNEEIQLNSFNWLLELLNCQSNFLVPSLTPKLIPSILPFLSHNNQQINGLVKSLNFKLFDVIKNLNDLNSFDFQLTLSNLTIQLLNDLTETRVAALDWMLMLQEKSSNKIFNLQDGTFPALLKTLSDPSEHVVKRDLRLLAQVSKSSSLDYFNAFIKNLIKLFSTDRRLLEKRGSLIIRQLSLSLGSSKIYNALADILQYEDDLDFASFLVQKLTVVLITAPELADLRKRLKCFESKDDELLFCKIYKSWSHNAISIFTICLLSQHFEHASELLYIM